MIKKITKGFLCSIVLGILCSQAVYAEATIITNASATTYTTDQSKIDAVTGPAFGISASEYIAGTTATATTTAPGEVISTDVAPPVLTDTLRAADAVTGLIGTFKTTGYCNCSKCSSAGHDLTATGTVPKSGHTVAADFSILPAGTKIRIGEDPTIYTVEDTGVKGQVVDVYYDTHKVALSHGVSYQNIYLVK